MAEDWVGTQLSVYNDFEEDGFAITIRRPGSPGTFNASTLEYDGAGTNTDYSTYALKKRFNAVEQNMMRQQDVLVQSNDYLLIFPAYGLPDLTLDDKVVIDSTELTIVALDPVDPGNVRLLYRALIHG